MNKLILTFKLMLIFILPLILTACYEYEEDRNPPFNNIIVGEWSLIHEVGSADYYENGKKYTEYWDFQIGDYAFQNATLSLKQNQSGFIKRGNKSNYFDYIVNRGVLILYEDYGKTSYYSINYMSQSELSISIEESDFDNKMVFKRKNR